jgi:hypothetical protein
MRKPSEPREIKSWRGVRAGNVAGVIALLASGEAAWVTGAHEPAGGGGQML